MSKVSVPVVPADLLADVGTQIDVLSLQAGRAHAIVNLVDKDGAPVSGVEVLPLAGGRSGSILRRGSFLRARG
ncbi:MAG: hypothetical protein R3B70_14055 [Polyangiaceae bacterium]